jgi:dihydropteroate synthase
MANFQKSQFKLMGVLNCTPNSFSDGGELTTPEDLLNKIKMFGNVDAIDIGAESTAPMNQSISWKEEWERLKPHLNILKQIPCAISIDSYHPETIEEVLKFYRDNGLGQDFIWNDVSGKFDYFVKDFLSIAPNFYYVFSHNLAPTRDLTGRHMDYVKDGLVLEDLVEYFKPYRLPQVIFDPCFGFSKSYEHNWMILDRFSELLDKVSHDHWLIGVSRKSFIRKKYNLALSDREKLDLKSLEVINSLNLRSSVWIRTHRPEMFSRSPL